MRLKNPRPYVLILALLSVAGGELPPDRQPLSAPVPQGEDEAPLILPTAPDAGGDEAGDTSWSASTPQEIEQQSRTGLIVSAFGAAGALGGISGLFFFNSLTAVTPGQRAGLRRLGFVFAGISAAALATGLVLWLTLPSPDVTVALGTGGTDLRLMVRF